MNNEYITEISQEIPMVLLHRRNVSYSLEQGGRVPPKKGKKTFRGDFVDCDNYRGSFLLTGHFLSLGHRKLGCISGPPMLSNAFERLRGFEDALEKYNAVSKNFPRRVITEFTYEGGYGAMGELLSGKNRPTAIVTMNNATTLGALKYFLDHNIRIPEEYSIGNFGTIQRNELLFVQPTYVTLDTNEIGSMIARALLSRIENTGIKNRDFIYSPRLVTGNAEKKLGRKAAPDLSSIV
jgi:LacI family transcriptional regulator